MFNFLDITLKFHTIAMFVITDLEQLCLLCNKICSFVYSAMVWAGRVGRHCSITDTRMLLQKYLCSKYFLETDFTTSGRIHLNRVAIPCVSDLTSHSAPQPYMPSVHIPYLDSLLSPLTPEDNLHVLPPIRTYSKMLLTSLAAIPTLVLAESPTSLQIPAFQLSSLASTFVAEETSFTPSSLNVKASDRELRHISCQSSSSKPRARHSLLKELNLASLSQLISNKRKLYERIRNKESALCKLKKKYKAKR
jgi:hypothetical protein